MSTYQNLLDEVRVLLQDTDTDTERFTDAVLISILNRGITDLCKSRPDACYDLFSSNSLNIPVVVASGAVAPQVNLSANFDFDLMFYTPLVAYVAGVAEITDDEYTVDGRAQMLIQQFRSTLLGV